MTAAVADQRPVDGHRAPLQDVIIRDAAETDLPAIVEIYNAAIRGRIATAQLEEVSVEQQLPWFREHSSGTHPLWIAEKNGRVAGWLSFQPFKKRSAYRGTAEIGVYVHEQFRRAGVGRILLELAIARAPSLALSALVGSIFAHNEASLRLFEQAGFERWGVLPRVAKVDSVEHDVVIMGRYLGPLI
ncbi:MAG TPA: GNAT family N-acetyltransferase [Chthoniobacterales bacterium]|nr:GNAT family N-acetyltransferase [Chthoniobacterales bacterium]